MQSLLLTTLSRPLLEDEVDRWTRGDSVERFVTLSRMLNRPDLVRTSLFVKAATDVIEGGTRAQVVNLCYTVGAWHDTRISHLTTALDSALGRRIEEDTKTANEYLYALVHINRMRAAQYVDQALTRLMDNVSDLDVRNTFWLVVNAVAAVDVSRREKVRQVVDKIACEWKTSTPTLPDELALAGVTAYERRYRRNLVVLDTGSNAEEIYARALSPPITFSQLYAVIVCQQSGAGTEEWFRGLTRAIGLPQPEFRRIWLRLPSRTRRFLLQMTSHAMLSISPSLSELASQFASEVGREHADGIWEHDVPSRLQVTLRAGGYDMAQMLLSRRGAAWAEHLSKKRISGNSAISMLFEVAAIAYYRPTVQGVARDLVAVASGSIEQTQEMSSAMSGLARLVVGEQFSQENMSLRALPKQGTDPLTRILAAAACGGCPTKSDVRTVERCLSDTEREYLHSILLNNSA